MERTIGYVRVSKEEKGKEKVSPAQQKDSIVSFCKSQDWKLIDCVGDRGFSGKNLKRPALQKILKDIKEGKNKFDVIIVWKTDRLTRRLKDLLNLYELFEKRGIKLKSITEPIDTETAIGKMIFQMFGVIAEWQWTTISENNKATAKTLKKQGRILGAKRLTPFGFKKINSGRVIEDLKPNKDFPILKKILNRNNYVRDLAKETGKPISTIYHIRENPIYEKLGIQ